MHKVQLVHSFIP